eukprot:6764100-Prymnesium_polylepis.1
MRRRRSGAGRRTADESTSLVRAGRGRVWREPQDGVCLGCRPRGGARVGQPVACCLDFVAIHLSNKWRREG